MPDAKKNFQHLDHNLNPVGKGWIDPTNPDDTFEEQLATSKDDAAQAQGFVDGEAARQDSLMRTQIGSVIAGQENPPLTLAKSQNSPYDATKVLLTPQQVEKRRAISDISDGFGGPLNLDWILEQTNGDVIPGFDKVTVQTDLTATEMTGLNKTAPYLYRPMRDTDGFALYIYLPLGFSDLVDREVGILIFGSALTEFIRYSFFNVAGNPNFEAVHVNGAAETPLDSGALVAFGENVPTWVRLVRDKTGGPNSWVGSVSTTGPLTGYVSAGSWTQAIVADKFGLMASNKGNATVQYAADFGYVSFDMTLFG